MGKFGEIDVRMDFPLFGKKVLQYRFGLDTNEFFSKSTIEEVDIARMDEIKRDSGFQAFRFSSFLLKPRHGS